MRPTGSAKAVRRTARLGGLPQMPGRRPGIGGEADLKHPGSHGWRSAQVRGGAGPHRACFAPDQARGTHPPELTCRGMVHLMYVCLRHTHRYMAMRSRAWPYVWCYAPCAAHGYEGRTYGPRTHVRAHITAVLRQAPPALVCSAQGRRRTRWGVSSPASSRAATRPLWLLEASPHVVPALARPAPMDSQVPHMAQLLRRRGVRRVHHGSLRAHRWERFRIGHVPTARPRPAFICFAPRAFRPRAVWFECVVWPASQAAHMRHDPLPDP